MKGQLLSDSWENACPGFNRLVAGERHLDYDGDGLDNLAEQSYGTNPSAADSDGGKANDGQEISDGTNPNYKLDDRVKATGSCFDSRG